MCLLRCECLASGDPKILQYERCRTLRETPWPSFGEFLGTSKMLLEASGMGFGDSCRVANIKRCKSTVFEYPKIASNIVFFPRDPFFDLQKVRKRGPGPSKIEQKSDPILEAPKMKSEQTLPHFCSFLHTKNDQKSMFFSFENGSENGLVLEPLKKHKFFYLSSN